MPLLPIIFLLWCSPPHKQQVAGQSLPLCPPLLFLKDSGASHLPEGATSSKLATLFPLPTTNTSAPSWFFVSFLLSHYKGISSRQGLLVSSAQTVSTQAGAGWTTRADVLIVSSMSNMDTNTRLHTCACLTSHIYKPDPTNTDACLHIHTYQNSIHVYTRLHIHPHLIPHTIPYAHVYPDPRHAHAHTRVSRRGMCVSYGLP